MTYIVEDQQFIDYFTYVDESFAPITGKVAGDFTIEVSGPSGTVSNANIGIAEVDAINNAGKYRVTYATNSFVANQGDYSVEIYEAGSSTGRWKAEYSVRDGDTYLSSLASFTATANDGRITDGTNPIAGASVILTNGIGEQVAVVTTDGDGLWGPVYLHETASCYVQKSGFAQGTFSISVSGTTATGPGADVALTATSTSSLTAGNFLSYAREQAADRVGAHTDKILYQIVNAAQDMVARRSQSQWYRRSYELTINPEYNTGTLDVTNGSTTITLTGGTFPSWVDSLCHIRLNNILHRVASRDSDTQLTLESAYIKDSDTALTGWQLFKSVYDLPNDWFKMRDLTYTDSYTDATDPVPFDEIERQRAIAHTTSNVPYAWCVANHNLHLWPAPSEQKIMLITYYAKPQAVATEADTVDIDDNMIDLMYACVDYHVAKRFGTTAGGLGMRECSDVVQEALKEQLSNNMDSPRRKPPMRAKRFGAARHSYNVPDAQ